MGSQCTGRVKANVAQISGPVNLVGKQEALRVSRQRQKAKEENCTDRSKPTALVVRQKKFTQCVNEKNYWCIIYRRAKKTRCFERNEKICAQQGILDGLLQYSLLQSCLLFSEDENCARLQHLTALLLILIINQQCINLNEIPPPRALGPGHN